MNTNAVHASGGEGEQQYPCVTEQTAAQVLLVQDVPCLVIRLAPLLRAANCSTWRGGGALRKVQYAITSAAIEDTVSLHLRTHYGTKSKGVGRRYCPTRTLTRHQVAVTSFRLRRLYPRQNPHRYLMERRMTGSESRAGVVSSTLTVICAGTAL
jgi:hypothetical protein